MNAGGNATATNSSSYLRFPLTVFAAVWGLRFGSTTIRLAPGEFGLILAGRFYNTTLLATRISPDWRIIVDNDLLELRWSPHTDQARTINMWLHLRFDDRAVFADFNRRFWECYWEAQEHTRILQQRLDLVAHASPSNFTRYCRHYLGEDYFDNLQDSEDEDWGRDGDGNGGIEDGSVGEYDVADT